MVDERVKELLIQRGFECLTSVFAGKHFDSYHKCFRIKERHTGYWRNFMQRYFMLEWTY